MRDHVTPWVTAWILGLVLAGAGCGGEVRPPTASGLGVNGAEIPPALRAELKRVSDRTAQEAIVQAWQARRYEVAALLEQRSRGWLIVDTRRSQSGQVYDYVLANTLYPDAPDAPFAAPPTVLRASTDAGVQRALTELEADPTLQPPAGTIPVVRPYLEPYVNGDVRARDLAEYMDLVWPKPTPAFANNRLYGFHIDSHANIGTDGNINLWNYQEVASNEMSLLQTAALCRGTSAGTTMEAIEVGFQKAPSKYGDVNVHLFTYFRTAGAATGDRVGGYNMDVQGFIQAAGAPFPPGAGMNTNTFSTIDGTQFECKIEVQLFQGNWWVFACGSWIGYYPTQSSTVVAASRINFDLIGSGTCEINWFGEIFDPTPLQWTNADIGSGRFASEGYARAAYIREPFLIHSGTGLTWFSSAVPATGNGYDPDRYTVSSVFENGGTGWDRWFYVGGPGGKVHGRRHGVDHQRVEPVVEDPEVVKHAIREPTGREGVEHEAASPRVSASGEVQR